ncbi:MAG: hypothetical protein LBD41_04100 [Clostridiales Family XIII bacterium]|nr:hypothetical protein [Clostridiales Family XIII bacterium]
MSNGNDITKFSLPIQENELHSVVFGISNIEIIKNLLGAFYFDQEKGWTHLKRGKVIGKNFFSIRSLISGLSNRSDDELLQQIKFIKTQIKKFKIILDIAELRTKINKLGVTPFINMPAEEIENDLDVLYCNRIQLDNELKRIKKVILQNSKFEEYIAEYKLIVKAPNGEEIPVNKNTLLGYNDITDLLITREKILSRKISDIDQKISNLNEKLNSIYAPNKLLETTVLSKSIQEFSEDIKQFSLKTLKIDLDPLAISRLINSLVKEKDKLNIELIQNQKQDKPLIEELHNLILTYAKKLGVRNILVKTDKNNKDDLFNINLDLVSGAILQKLVFAFKISYIKLIKKHTNQILPIIIDSPNGRELTRKLTDTMMEILSNDFSDHQIIIASIYKNYNFESMNIIELKDKFLTS